ncbi:hybrid sensor histidine kinase/response regulator, partial [Paraburkholderia sp. SIMBA_030]
RRAPDGTFAGVVSVALRPSYFDAFYRELLGGNDGLPMTTTLVRADGAVLAHYPRRPREPAAVAADSPFAQAMKEGRRAGVTRMHSNIDGD